MNFLNFLTSGAGIFNFNLQSLSLNNTNSNTLPRQVDISMIRHQSSSEEKQGQQPQVPQVQDQNKLMDMILTPPQAELLSHQQQLINQYMHLNLQLLSKKISTLQNHQVEKKEEPSVMDVKSNKKKIKKENTACGHNDRQHYAKGMCNNCYHKNGRTKKPWKCQHDKLYANGLCQNCYINLYNKMKREKVSSDSMHFDVSESKQANSEPKLQQSH